MVRRVIIFCAEHRLLVLGLSAVLCLLSLRALRAVPLDALPDLSDTQVIIGCRYERSPNIIEDQVSYPIITALLGAPRVKAIRGYSDYGAAFIYVLFEDGTDIYWARSRVLEYLSKIQPRLPREATVELGPDASGVGWVYQYALVDESGRHSLDELRSLQDFFLRFQLQAVPGVAEVATLGGALRQYQVTVDPARLAAARLSMGEIADALRRSNSEAGGRLIELSGKEYMVRGRGYLRSAADIEGVVLRNSGTGTPLRIGDVARVSIGPDLRRGIADLDGRGDVVGGIVVMRHGDSAEATLARVKARIAALGPSLPPGVQIVPTYDRADLIDRAIATLRDKLTEEMIIVSLVILLFLWHIPSAIVPILTIPVAVLLSFGPLYLLGVPTNIMTLGGIAISIGVLVDGAIVEVENAYKRLESWREHKAGDFHAVRLQAILEVGPSVFFSLLVVAVAFLPIFALVEQEGRLFRPLAISKNLAMAIAAILAVTLDPALRMTLSRMEPYHFRPALLARLCTHLFVGTYYKEERHPISRLLFRAYGPLCHLVLRHPWATVLGALVLCATTVPVYLRLGSEFMPPLQEGTILYMPTTLPGISVTEAGRLLQTQDRLLGAFPEVERVFGKAGRAETVTDPAPLSMMETTVVLRPESAWRKRARFYSDLPAPLQGLFRPLWPDHISYDELIAQMDAALRLPGVTNAWTQPIRARIDMLATGIRTPIGIKIFGADPAELSRLGEQVEALLRHLPQTRSVFAERTASGYFVDFELRRDELARAGLLVDDANAVILSAIGGETVTTTVMGRERYTVSVRYPRELREDLEGLARVLVTTPQGAQVPLGQLADIRLTSGPAMLRDEDGLLSTYVYVDVDTSAHDLGGYVSAAQAALSTLRLPPGYALRLSGQYENMLRVRQRLQVVVPVALVLIFLLLYANLRDPRKAALVMLAVPLSAIGAIWLLYLLGYNLSIAVWVGLIALLGLDAETGVFMLMYLDLAIAEARKGGRLQGEADLREAIFSGAVKRVRPKAMTVCAAMMGLLPILWGSGIGADVMKRIATPMVGGLLTSFLLELLVYPAIYLLWQRRHLPR